MIVKVKEELAVAIFDGCGLVKEVGDIVKAFLTGGLFKLFVEIAVVFFVLGGKAEIVRKIPFFPKRETCRDFDVVNRVFARTLNVGVEHSAVVEFVLDIQKLERNIAYLCYDKYHTIMTVGIYAKHNDTPESCRVRGVIDEVVKGFPEVIQTHGFFIDYETTTVNFDMIVSIDADERKIYTLVHDKLHELLPEYHSHIVLDRDFSLT